MNKLSVISFSMLLIIALTAGIVPNVKATAWTKQPPFPDAYAKAWRGDHYPERETWAANASADKSTGDMKAYIQSYIDVGGYLNVYFETAICDFVYIERSGTLDISAVVSLNGHAHLYGICVIAGGFTTVWSLEVWLVVDDLSAGTNLLNWKVNTWQDSDWGVVGDIVDRGTNFNWDYNIPQVPVPVEQGHNYKVSVKFVGWTGVSAYGIAAAQANIGIDFESNPFRMKLKWITYNFSPNNSPPNTPSTPSGYTSGHTGTSYTYSTSTTDPDGDNICYQFDWGDGSTTTTGYYSNGSVVSASHTWSSSGTYYVKVCAEDTYGAWSSWSNPLTVAIHIPILSISASSGGTTNPSPGTYSYDYGTSVTVTATPYSGYVFSYWSLDGTSSYSNPITVTMNSDHTLTAYFRYSGGGWYCPYVYTWAGQQYIMDNNLLPASETSNGADIEDYYMLEQPLVPMYQVTRHSVYSLQIREFDEHDYFDQVKLFAVDHSSNVNVAVSPYGEILTYSNPESPITASDDGNFDVLSLLTSVDENYYQGYNGSYVTLTFAPTDVSSGVKLVIREDTMIKCPIYVQVLNATEDWNTVATFHTRTYWATDIINMTDYLPDANGDLKVRLCFVSNSKIDYVGLDTTPQASVKTYEANLISAVHSTQGNVKPLLMENDQTYAELTPGQRIQLTFQLPNNRNEERTFILYAEGHYTRIET